MIPARMPRNKDDNRINKTVRSKRVLNNKRLFEAIVDSGKQIPLTMHFFVTRYPGTGVFLPS